jgi:hypothetical protein
MKPSSAEGMECPVATTGWFSFMAVTEDTIAADGESLGTAGQLLVALNCNVFRKR